MTLGPQFLEHMALRTELGGLIAENRRLYPLPEGVDGASHGQPGVAKLGDVSAQNKYLREKIASTKISNEIGRGERQPTEKRFG
jgi:hypothetical protein